MLVEPSFKTAKRLFAAFQGGLKALSSAAFRNAPLCLGSVTHSRVGILNLLIAMMQDSTALGCPGVCGGPLALSGGDAPWQQCGERPAATQSGCRSEDQG